MGDMNKRSRGGWQFQQRILGREKQGGIYGEQNPDPAPDAYAVQRTDGGFLVTHYADAGAEKPCCRPVSVRLRAGESDHDALGRAAAMIEKQHEPTRAIA